MIDPTYLVIGIKFALLCVAVDILVTAPLVYLWVDVIRGNVSLFDDPTPQGVALFHREIGHAAITVESFAFVGALGIAALWVIGHFFVLL